MKNTMKQWIALLLTVLLCLLAVGCGEKPAPVDEEVSSLIGAEDVSYLEHGDEVESVVAEASTVAEETLKDVQDVPDAVESTKTDVESVPAEQKEVEQQPSLSASEKDVSPVQFDGPPEDMEVTDHVEQSLDAFVAWLNSKEALTEENGTFAEAVNFYRKRGGIFLGFTSLADQKVKYYRLYRDGRLGVGFQDYGLVISPFSAEKVVAAREGIVSYLKSDGKAVVQTMQTSDLLSITRESPNYYAERSVAIASKQIDAVYHIRRTELPNQVDTSTKPIFIRHLHWIQDGFYVEVALRSTDTAEKAWNYDQEFVSSLSFREVALSASPLQAAK